MAGRLGKLDTGERRGFGEPAVHLSGKRIRFEDHDRNAQGFGGYKERKAVKTAKTDHCVGTKLSQDGKALEDPFHHR